MLQITAGRNGVTVRTNLSNLEITTYTERIIKIRGWVDTMRNRVAAKQVLDAICIIAEQNGKPVQCYFEELLTAVQRQTINN